MNRLIDKFKLNDCKEIDRSIEKKIKILKLDIVRVEQLTAELCEENFSVDNLCGIIYRGTNHVHNWIEQLDSTTKMYLITEDKINRIDDVLKNPLNKDFPPVAMINGKYYIDEGDGKHRLTIAKCIGNKKAKVIINKYIKK